MARSSHSWRNNSVTTYVSAAQLAERYSVNKATIWRWAGNGTLPTPVKLSEQTTRWKLEDIEKRDAERAGEAA